MQKETNKNKININYEYVHRRRSFYWKTGWIKSLTSPSKHEKQVNRLWWMVNMVLWKNVIEILLNSSKVKHNTESIFSHRCLNLAHHQFHRLVNPTLSSSLRRLRWTEALHLDSDTVAFGRRSQSPMNRLQFCDFRSRVRPTICLCEQNKFQSRLSHTSSIFGFSPRYVWIRSRVHGI